MAIDVGILLPTIGQLGMELADLREVARHAEAVGLDSLWAGDHLNMGNVPLLECTLAMTTAAAVTERVQLGFSVMLAAARSPVWTAKQLATLQYLSGNRVQFGVGVGAKWPDEWIASGVPLNERGRRTDNLLKVLPGLLSGRPTTLLGVPGEPEVSLLPAVEVPPIWIGGTGERSMRRTVTLADGWLTTITAPSDIRANVKRLNELADEHGRPQPKVGTMIYGAVTPEPSRDAVEVMAEKLASTYHLSPDLTRQIVVGGSPEQTAEGLARYVDAGVEQFVVALEGTEWRTQYELLARARDLLVT